MGARTYLGVILVMVALVATAGAVAPPATADLYGEPCSDNALIAREQDPNSTTGSPPLVCAGDHWTLAPTPEVSARQTMGASCNAQGGTTAVADDPSSGSMYYAMCYQGAWTRYRP
jgi:hypothetical protein